MASQQCGSTCPVEGGFLIHNPNVGGNAVLLTLYALLIPATFYLGYRFRTPAFSVILAIGLLLEVLGFAGRILLHGDRSHQGFFTLMLLGSVLGPVFMSSSIIVVLPHVLAIYGENFSPRKPIRTMLFLHSTLGVGMSMQVVGIVLVVYGFGGISRDHGADIISGGFGCQILALFASIGLYLRFVLRLSSGRESPDLKHSEIYVSSRFSRFLRCTEVATVLLLGYSTYRIIEMVGGIRESLFQSEPAFLLVNGLVPLIACALMTITHPGAAFGSSWKETSPRHVRPRPPPLHYPFGYIVHHRYDPNIRQQFSPSTQRPLRESMPPPVYGSYGLPASPRPSSKPSSPQLCSPMSALTGSTGRMSERWDRRLAPPEMVDSDALW